MPQFIQIALCGPPTGGVTEYLTGPVTWSCSSASLAGPLLLVGGQPVVTYSTTPEIPEVFGTWCAAACTVVAPPLTPGGMIAAVRPPLPALLLLRLAAYQATPPMINAATAPIAPAVIRLRRLSARFC